MDARMVQIEPSVVIVSRRPGIIRGGMRHPAVAAHAPGAFTPEQLVDIVGEPEITVVVGAIVTNELLLRAAGEIAQQTGLDDDVNMFEALVAASQTNAPLPPALGPATEAAVGKAASVKKGGKQS